MARIAAKLDVISGARLCLSSFSCNIKGSNSDPSRDLDEKTLLAIAEKTGGRYFRAKNTQELAQIYQLFKR
jgi:hypothetical protein